MARFMLIVFISNQIEDTIDFDETIHLERGQNLFEIHVQKARNFLDNTALCWHFFFIWSQLNIILSIFSPLLILLSYDIILLSLC